MNDVELAIRLTADADQATRALADVGDSAQRMGRDVADAAADADRAADRLRGMSSAAEGLDDAGSRATGALGALAAGASALGMEEYAAKMEHAAQLTDGLSGVGQTASLVMDGYRAATNNARIATIAKTAADKVQTVALKAQAVAQRLVNAAQRANPIGLIITAILVLVGLLVVLYKRNERFREIVQSVAAKARAAFGRVIDVIRSVIGWVQDKLGGAFRVYAALVQRYISVVVAVIKRIIGTVQTVAGWIVRFGQTNARVFQAVRDKVATVFEAVRSVISTKVEAVKRIADTIRTKFSAVWDGVKSAADTVFDAILTPINKVRDAIDKVLDLISKIDLPDLGGLLRTVGGGRTLPATGTSGGGGSITYVENTVNIYGVVGDGNRVAAIVRKALDDRARALGSVAV